MPELGVVSLYYLLSQEPCPADFTHRILKFGALAIVLALKFGLRQTECQCPLGYVSPVGKIDTQVMSLGDLTGSEFGFGKNEVFELTQST